MARLKEKYREEIVPELMKEFGYSNVMEAPKLEKIVVNVGVGDQ
jgi:large subunit ribosomal protein L5